MLESILHRLTNSVLENETFVSYFNQHIQHKQDHAKILLKNATKHLDPLKQVYEAQGSGYKNFIHHVKELDVSHATSTFDLTQKMQTVIKNLLVKTTETMKK